MMNVKTYAKFRQVKVTKRGKEIFDRRATLNAIKNRIAEIRKEIENERVSYGEIAELQELSGYIDPSDTMLLEWAGVPELQEQ